MVDYIAYLLHVLYLRRGENESQKSEQTQNLEHCHVLAVYMLDMWITYTIVSQAVAY